MSLLILKSMKSNFISLSFVGMLEGIKFLIDFVLHIDQHIGQFISEYGLLTYGILFVVIFIETWVVVMPFLPWDSLVFAAGAFAALDNPLNIFCLRGLLCAAAILGDTANYHIGKFLWKKAFQKYPRIFKPQYLEKTESFYDKYGAMTIIYARFVPIVRTFAPFVAGVGKMKYRKFIAYNFVGGFVRVSLFTWVGYFFGNIEVVQKNFTFVVLWIIFISAIPVIVWWIKSFLSSKTQK